MYLLVVYVVKKSVFSTEKDSFGKHIYVHWTRIRVTLIMNYFMTRNSGNLISSWFVFLNQFNEWAFGYQYNLLTYVCYDQYLILFSSCNVISAKIYSLSFTKALQERIQSVTQLASTPRLQKVSIDLICHICEFIGNYFKYYSVSHR